MTRTEARAIIEQAKQQYQNNYSPTAITLYEYWAQINRIVDADTFDMAVAVGFNCTFNNRFRLVGINCPETYGVKKNSDEYKAGLAAVNAVKQLVQEGDWVEVKVFFGEKEKYGRWLCEVIANGESLNEKLLTQGHAVPTI